MLRAWTAGPFPLPAPRHRACGATCRGIAELLPAPVPTRQRFRWSSCALRPYSETSGNIVFSSRAVLSPKIVPTSTGSIQGFSPPEDAAGGHPGSAQSGVDPGLDPRRHGHGPDPVPLTGQVRQHPPSLALLEIFEVD